MGVCDGWDDILGYIWGIYLEIYVVEIKYGSGLVMSFSQEGEEREFQEIQQVNKLFRML